MLVRSGTESVSRFDRKAGILPCLEPSEQGADVFEPEVLKCERRTGTRLFVRSRTECHHVCVSWDFVLPLVDLHFGDIHGVGGVLELEGL